MMLCKCGGPIRQHELVSGLTAWTCGACGRYERMGQMSREFAHSVLNRVKDGENIPREEVALALKATGDIT